jgi:hypothetical protein
MEAERERRFKLGPLEVWTEKRIVRLEEAPPPDSEIDLGFHVARVETEDELGHTRHRLELGFEPKIRKPRPRYGTGAKVCLAGLALVLLGLLLKALSLELWEAPVVFGALLATFFRWRLRDVWPDDFPILRRLLSAASRRARVRTSQERARSLVEAEHFVSRNTTPPTEGL